MGLDTQLLSAELYHFYQEVLISLQVQDLVGLKDQIKDKTYSLGNYQKKMGTYGKGREFVSFLNRLSVLHTEYKTFEEDFHDKLMIFIVGDGNVGKSTLLNAFVGYEAAKTSFVPLTWKIDVFDPGQSESTLLKFSDGTRKSLPVEKAKAFLSEEEAKTLAARKKYNEELRKVKDKITTSAELEEHKKYLGKKYLYVSPVTEARWPVKHNWILDQCLLVDTPGMNQYLNDNEQIGSIMDYYHKADGVIWLLDGNTIASANPKSAMEKLETSMSQVGGLRDNIIAVVNKIDLVEKNDGAQGAFKVMENAQRIYGKKFRHIVGISSKQAFEGFKNDDEAMMKLSGIQTLTETMKEVFISKSQEVKTISKMQGNQKLMNLVEIEIKTFYETIKKLRWKYQVVQSKYQPLRERLLEDLKDEIQGFFDSYLLETKSRIQTKVDFLAKGEGESFILKEMYQISTMEAQWKELLDKQREKVIVEVKQWQEFSMISEYTYIKVNHALMVPMKTPTVEIKGTALKGIKYFKPNNDSGFFSGVENLFGSISFAFRRSGIIDKIYQEISTTCESMKTEIITEHEKTLQKYEIECQGILDLSFQNMLIPYSKCDDLLKVSDLFLKNFMKVDLTNSTLRELLVRTS